MHTRNSDISSNFKTNNFLNAVIDPDIILMKYVKTNKNSGRNKYLF